MFFYQRHIANRCLSRTAIKHDWRLIGLLILSQPYELDATIARQ